jgi:hypothetical protein
MFSALLFTIDSQRTFVALQFALALKLPNLVNEWVNYWIVFDDKYLFD